jgi:hypothetical protein
MDGATEVTVQVETPEPTTAEPAAAAASTETAVAMEVGALRSEVDALKAENLTLKEQAEANRQAAESAQQTASSAFSEAISAQIATQEPEPEEAAGVIEVIPPAEPESGEDAPATKAGGLVGVVRTLFLGR